MAQEFQCKELGCSEKVIYERQTVRGVREISSKADGGTEVVYLTCARGHCHPYKVQVQEDKK